MRFLENLKIAKERGNITPNIEKALFDFFQTYKFAIESNGKKIETYQPILLTYLELIISQLKTPYPFGSYHSSLREPFDYYQFGLDFLRPIIIFEKSRVLGKAFIKKALNQLAQGHNVILLSNHQTEPDPQAISLLLEKDFARFAEQIIFVAGHRVTSDPLAVPFSLGRNLLCIYSKKHIEDNPELKEQRLIHNQRTMQIMGELLKTGGQCIFVAPSGGRDRINEYGKVVLSPFNPQSIEMFRLIASQSNRETHFYPLSLATYLLLPPPNSIDKELGENRYTTCTPIHLAVGEEIDMDHFPGHEESDKKTKRRLRSEYIFNLVNTNYHTLMPDAI